MEKPNSTVEINKGKKYLFQSCKNKNTNQVIGAYTPNKTLIVQDKIILGIRHGDDRSITKIKTQIFLKK